MTWHEFVTHVESHGVQPDDVLANVELDLYECSSPPKVERDETPNGADVVYVAIRTD